MSKPNPFANMFYLAVHLVLNILVVVLILNLIDIYFPVKHLLAGYHIDMHHFYAEIDTQKSLIPVFAAGAAFWYYQKRKAKTGDSVEKH